MRDTEIGKVAKSVQEIATLMQDLSALVIDQVRRCARPLFHVFPRHPNAS